MVIPMSSSDGPHPAISFALEERTMQWAKSAIIMCTVMLLNSAWAQTALAPVGVRLYHTPATSKSCSVENRRRLFRTIADNKTKGVIVSCDYGCECPKGGCSDTCCPTTKPK